MGTPSNWEREHIEWERMGRPFHEMRRQLGWGTVEQLSSRSFCSNIGHDEKEDVSWIMENVVKKTFGTHKPARGNREGTRLAMA